MVRIWSVLGLTRSYKRIIETGYCLRLILKGGGEKMKKTIILFGLIFVMLLALVTPAMAVPTKGQKVPVVQTTGATITTPTVCPRDGVTYPYTASSFWAANGFKDSGVVAQRRDTGQVMVTTLVIDGKTTLQGLSFNNYDRMWKYAVFDPTLPFPPPPAQPNQVGSDSITHYDAIWVYGDGGFEGNINLQITDYLGPSMNVKLNCVLQGFGSFGGQTLQLSVDSAVSNIWTGYLLKP
jgi:hypothetical protein